MSAPRRTSALALASALILLWAGCTSPVQLALDAPAGPAKTPVSDRTVFALKPLVDLRPASSRDTAGHVGGRTLQAAGAPAWVENSLLALAGRGFVVVPAGSAPPSGWRVQARLHQFYAASLDISKNAQVVIELEFRRPDTAGFSRVYRGRVNAMNWWNSAGEIDGAMRAAAEDCFKRIAADLERIAATSAET